MRNMKTNKILGHTLTISAIVLGVACGGDDSPAPKPDNNGVTTPDAGTDGMNSPDTSCVPTITECPSNACGALTDDCGGTIDCGACTCVAGQPIQAECGPCALGRVVCSSDTDGACVVPDVIDGKDCEDILFVETGAISGDGTASRPFGTLSSAISAAQSGDVILVAKTTTPYAESIVLKDGVSVSGAWDRQSQWVYDESIKADFEVPAPAAADVVGILAEDFSLPAVIENLKIKTANASPQMNNYGFVGTNALGLTVRRLEVRTGLGGNGADGIAGVQGSAGGPGANGVPFPIVYCDGQQDPQSFVAALKGKNLSCPTADGGNGGKGRLELQVGAVPASAGGASAQGAGGGGGGIEVNGSRDGKDGSSGLIFTQSADDGSRGESKGDVIANRWANLGGGGDGTAGQQGSGGGGGGGAANTPTVSSVGRFYGTGGGAGGAGGCGGTAGSGGVGGGGSFGLFLVLSNIDIKDSSFTGGAGGLGGRGGDGALGGPGGLGGAGESAICGQSVANGGDGGDGAGGQRGGAGGGGAGGVSYGGYCYESQPVLSGVDFDSQGSSLGGPGGQGGASGEPGASLDQFRCE